MSVTVEDSAGDVDTLDALVGSISVDLTMISQTMSSGSGLSRNVRIVTTT